MDAVEAGGAVPLEPPRDGLVRGQHELLDQPVGAVALAPLDGEHRAALPEQHLRLGEIEVHRPAAAPHRGQDLLQLRHPLEVGPEELPVRHALAVEHPRVAAAALAELAGAGQITIHLREDRRHIQERDLKLLEALADFAAIALENARHVQRIHELTITDDCTNLYNARHMNFILETEVYRSQRYGYEFSLVFIDLDHFKHVNDTHGHLMGSKLLGEIGQML